MNRKGENAVDYIPRDIKAGRGKSAHPPITDNGCFNRLPYRD